MDRVVFICSEELWGEGFPKGHPLKPERVKRAYELLLAYGAFDASRSHVVAPRQAGRDDLLLFHTQEYVDAVASLSRGERSVDSRHYNFRPDETPAFPGMYEIAGLRVGGAMAAAQLLLSGEAQATFNPSGGMHHAKPALASGFCIFNDVAVVIHWLLRQGLRVAYVDIDAHHADGVQAAFYETDQVLTISLHQAGILFYPGTGFPDEIGTGTGCGYSINLPFLPYTGDELYLWGFRQVAPPLVRQFAPDVLVTQLGVDTHHHDPLAKLALTTHGYVALIEELKTLADEIGKWLAFGGGGYSIDVVPRAWTLAYGVMSGQTFPDEFPPEYSQRYGPGHLHDVEGPEPGEEWVKEEWVAKDACAYVEKSLATLRELTQEVWQW